MFELLELGDRGGVAVLLEGGAGADVRDGVVFGSGGEEQRAAGLVAGVDLGLGVEGEVGRRGLEQWPGRRGNRPFAEQFGGLFLGQGVAEAEPEFLQRQGYRLVQVRGIAQRGQRRAELGERQGQDALDLGGVDGDGGYAGSLASSFSVNRPPKECPMRIGAASSESMILV